MLLFSCYDDCESIQFTTRSDSYRVDPAIECQNKEMQNLATEGIKTHTDRAFWKLWR